MDRDYFIKLTSALYEVTELLPEEEPLRFDLRSRANKILIDLAPYHFSQNNIPSSTTMNIIRNIEVIESLFALAREQAWITEDNFLILEEEYQQVKNSLRLTEKSSSRREKEKETVRPSFSSKRKVSSDQNQSSDSVQIEDQKSNGITERQSKILKMLQFRPKAGISEVKKEFSDLSKRTIRRDLEKLTVNHLIKKNGEGVSTSYQIIPVDKT